MTSAIMPPSLIAGIVCRLMKLGSRKCTLERAGAAVGDQRARPARRAATRSAGRPGPAGTRKPSVTSLKWWISDSIDWPMIFADVLEGVAHAVAAERELGGPGDLLVGDHDRARLQPVEGLLDDLERLVHLGDAQHDSGP